MKTKKVKLLIADDHNLVRNGIVSILENSPKHQFEIDQAKNGDEAVTMAKKSKYDIILMDITMPEKDGLTATKEILDFKKTYKVLTLTMHDEVSYVHEALDNGASGYVLKDAPPEELLLAVSTVLNGKKYLSSEMSLRVYETRVTKGKSEKTFFTSREMQVIKQLVKGKTSSEIAKELCLAKRTVDTHRANIMSKTNSKNAAGIIKYVYENEVLPQKKA